MKYSVDKIIKEKIKGCEIIKLILNIIFYQMKKPNEPHYTFRTPLHFLQILL